MERKLPKGWRMVKLGDVCEINIGTRNPAENNYGDFVYVDIASVDNVAGIINAPRTIANSDAPSRARKIIKANDIIVSTVRPNLNAVAKVPEELNNQICSTGFCVLRTLPDIADYRFIYAITRSKHFVEFLTKKTKGANYPAVLDKDIFNFLTPLPPLQTQKKIVEILEEADTLRKLRKRADEKMQDLIPSLFVEMFGDPIANHKNWQSKRIEDICISFQNGIGKNKEYYGNGIKIANISDLYDSFRFKPVHFSYIQASDKEVELYRLNWGDILFVRSSVKKEGVAYCSAFNSAEEICLFSSFMIRAIPNKKIVHPYFLSSCLRTPQMRKRLINVSNTVAITNISQPALKKIMIPLPPLYLQQQFAARAEEIEAEKTRQAESRKKLDELFNSLMQKAFTGELVA